MRLEQELFRTRYIAERALQTQDFSWIEQEVSLLSTNMQMNAYVIIDSDSIIHFANHVIWQDSSARNVLEGYSSELHKAVVQSNEPQIHVDFDRLSIQAYYPITNIRRFSFSRSIELIYLEYDISANIEKATESLIDRFVKVWGIGGVVLLVFCVLCYWLWIYPLKQLSRAAKNVDAESFHIDKFCFSSEINTLKDYLNSVSGKLKRSKKRLNDAEQRWLFSVESTRNGIWDWDLVSGHVYVSDRWKEILGFQPYELDLDYAIWESRLHREDKAAVIALLQKYIEEQEGQYESVHRLRHKDGRFVWVLDSGKIIEWDNKGKPTRIVGTITDVSGDIKAHRVEVDKKAGSAGLTDIINREALSDSLFDLQVHSRKVRQHSAVLLINLDNFKLLSDALGQQLGDRLLMQIAARLSGTFASSGMVARLGSDEFIFLANNLGADIEQAHKRAFALACEVRQLIGRSFAIADQNLSISARVGVAVVDGVESLEPQTILARADNALEQAKDARSEGCAIYHPQLDVNQVQPFKLNHELTTAFQAGHIKVVYQPVVDRQGALMSVEALPRWYHQQFGFINPAKFISAAELSDFIFEFELWVLESVCQFILAIGDDAPPVSINISSRHFHQDHFASVLENAIQSRGISPAKLLIELTEDVFAVNSQYARAKIKRLQQFGLRFVLDDLGAGLCSLHQLQGVTFAQVKLAPSYIDKDKHDDESQVVLCALIELASRLNYVVIGKRVETKAQLNHLIHAKCHGFQGYIFSRPLNKQDITQLIKSKLSLSVAS